MSEAKRKIFGLFRSKSAAVQPQEPSQNGREKDRDRDKDRERKSHRERESTQHSSRRKTRPRSSHNLQTKSSPSRRASNASVPARATLSPDLLTVWPPKGYSRHESLSQGRAMEHIASGVPVFRGIRKSIPHATEEYYQLYATCKGNGGVGTDRGEVYTGAFAACSMSLLNSGGLPPRYPWETLEQPSMAFCYGVQPGTVTLNHWVSLSGRLNPGIELRDPGIVPRDVDLSTVLDRLIFLEKGFEEEYEDLMYKNLYRNLLKDPDRLFNPHKAMEKQISDLIMVLSRKQWVDFSRPENQVVAKFFANAYYRDQGRYKLFFHQLLLSMELFLRIHSKQHTNYAKEKLLAQLPPCIQWDLALAMKWRECMSIRKFESGGNPETIKFHLHNKKAQVKALRKFARVMKWPNLARVDEVLKDRDVDATPLEDRSSDAMSYFTGMILPGATLPWLIMNSLIDCDSDAGGNALAALSHLHPHSGFQYRGQTYWSATSIVGKVLAPTCREVAGWIGPSRPAPDLSRIQIARIRQRRPKQRLAVSDIASMTERSDCLGPPSDRYPVCEFQLLLPDNDPDSLVNTIRIEKLALKAMSSASTGVSPSRSRSSSQGKDDGKPLTYDAAVQFAIGGRSWPLRLSYDVSFIFAYPCERGPHPLFFDYVYKAVKIDELLTVMNWGGLNMNINPGSKYSSLSRAVAGGGGGSGSPGGDCEDDDEEKVLVVEAFGVTDNEVLARAWCSHWGLSAVVADVEKSCMACAIREAYAACLNVVILVDGASTRDGDS